MAEQQEIRRQTAYKCDIATLNKGTFVKKEGWESNYLITEYGDFSRVNILAVVVGKEENSIVLDDGTGQISGRLFDNTKQLDKINVGNVVLVIGRPREFNGKIYLTIEIVKNIEPSWVAYRKKELSLIKKIRELGNIVKVEKKSAEPEIIENTSTLGSKERMSKLIKELDRGDGANIDDVIRLCKISNGEDIISDMMMRGEVYESKAGHVRLM
jgi:RPA family protein